MHGVDEIEAVLRANLTDLRKPVQSRSKLSHLH